MQRDMKLTGIPLDRPDRRDLEKTNQIKPESLLW